MEGRFKVGDQVMYDGEYFKLTKYKVTSKGGRFLAFNSKGREIMLEEEYLEYFGKKVLTLFK